MRWIVSLFFVALALQPARASLVTLTFDGYVDQCSAPSCKLSAPAQMSVTYDTSVVGVQNQPQEMTYTGAVTQLTIGSFSFASPTAANTINVYDNFFNGPGYVDMVGVYVDDGTNNGLLLIEGFNALSPSTLLNSLQLPTSLDDSEITTLIGVVVVDLNRNESEIVSPFAPVVPEPSTWAMLLIGFAGIGFAAYRRKRLSWRLPILPELLPYRPFPKA